MTIVYDESVSVDPVADYDAPTTFTFPANLSGSTVLYRVLLKITSPDILWDVFGRVHCLFPDDTPFCSLSHNLDEYQDAEGKVTRLLDLSKWQSLWASGDPIELKIGGYNDQGFFTLPRSYLAGVSLRLQISGADAGVTSNLRIVMSGSSFDGRRLTMANDRRVTQSG